MATSCWTMTSQHIIKINHHQQVSIKTDRGTKSCIVFLKPFGHVHYTRTGLVGLHKAKTSTVLCKQWRSSSTTKAFAIFPRVKVTGQSELNISSLTVAETSTTLRYWGIPRGVGFIFMRTSRLHVESSSNLYYHTNDLPPTRSLSMCLWNLSIQIWFDFV